MVSEQRRNLILVLCTVSYGDINLSFQISFQHQKVNFQFLNPREILDNHFRCYLFCVDTNNTQGIWIEY